MWPPATSQWPLPPEVGIKFLTGKMYRAQLRWTEVAPDNTHAHCWQAQETKKSHFYLYKRHKVLLCFAIFSCFKKSIKTAASYMTPLISLYILTSLGVWIRICDSPSPLDHHLGARLQPMGQSLTGRWNGMCVGAVVAPPLARLIDDSR